jgi:Flp pilus assembly pilin Flp
MEKLIKWYKRLQQNRWYERLQEYSRGQTMAEYALVLTLVAVGAYVAYQTLGTDISSFVTSLAGDI